MMICTSTWCVVLTILTSVAVVAASNDDAALKTESSSDYEYYYEYNNSNSDNNNNLNNKINNNNNNADNPDTPLNTDDWPAQQITDTEDGGGGGSSTTTTTRQPTENDDMQQQQIDVLTDTIIEETCKLDRGCLRRDHLNSTYLAHCHRYKLEYLFSSSILMSIMHGDESKCQMILREFMQLDEVVSQFDKLFKNLLTRYNCHNGYSVKWTCQDCKKAYKDWLCAINLPYYMHGEQVKPCISFCERVEQRCPYLHPITREQYGGQPVFICRDPNIPFVPSITPSIPYSEPTRCYELCHLSDNETELINDSLSKYAYNDCPHRDSIAEEVRSDPFYNRCQWSPELPPTSAATSGIARDTPPLTLASGGAASVVSSAEDSTDDSTSSGDLATSSFIKHQPSPSAPPAMVTPTGGVQVVNKHRNNNDYDDDGDHETMGKLERGPLNNEPHATNKGSPPPTPPPPTLAANNNNNRTSLASSNGQQKSHHHSGLDNDNDNDDDQDEDDDRAHNINNNNIDELIDKTPPHQHPVTGSSGQVNEHAHNEQHHVHNKTLAELRDILHQYKSQPKHRPGAHGSGSHLHHLHNGHDYSYN